MARRSGCQRNSCSRPDSGTLWAHTVSELIGEWMSVVTHTDDFMWHLIEDCVQPGLVTNANIHIHMTATLALTVNGLRSLFTWDVYVTAWHEYVLWRCRPEQHAVDV
jgi:hypothetical protein